MNTQKQQIPALETKAEVLPSFADACIFGHSHILFNLFVTSSESYQIYIKRTLSPIDINLVSLKHVIPKNTFSKIINWSPVKNEWG